jgi:hypothetical protein
MVNEMYAHGKHTSPLVPSSATDVRIFPPLKAVKSCVMGRRSWDAFSEAHGGLMGVFGYGKEILSVQPQTEAPEDSLATETSSLQPSCRSRAEHPYGGDQNWWLTRYYLLKGLVKATRVALGMHNSESFDEGRGAGPG